MLKHKRKQKICKLTLQSDESIVVSAMLIIDMRQNTVEHLSELYYLIIFLSLI